MKKINVLLLAAFLAAACSDSSSDVTNPANPNNPENPGDTENPGNPIVNKGEIVDNYLDVAERTYDGAYYSFLSLSSSLTSLHVYVDTREQQFANCQSQWRTAMGEYMKTLPIALSARDYAGSSATLQYIDVWPLNEDYTFSIFTGTSAYPQISEGTVKQWHQQGGQENVTRGYHSLEYLLWGADYTDPSLNLPGQATYLDFNSIGTESWAGRRGQLAVSVYSTLLKDMQFFWFGWEHESPIIYGDMVNAVIEQDNDVVIKNIFRGLVLATSELSQKHLQQPFVSGNDYTEHSKFSDNSLTDIKKALEGISNLYYGIVPLSETFPMEDGAGVDSLVRASDANLANEIAAAITAAGAAVNDIPAPFDNAIATQSPKVNVAIAKLESLKQKFIEGASAAGYTL
ncbi:hypothetical protein HYN59_01380 [Flavobacterium album]|uniref:Imelysin-like domain-containing protein n=1 Tax=Flavobacterium album TaxID=2175091 RepID=A0A2S1QU39_9FLAO|nr:imelysin family protein [Flavobacterium album]AWH83849.1 hypothetical protein HYN59_01380 [Flavobacterium album]